MVKWISPLVAAYNLLQNQESFALLYSCRQTSGSGRYSYIGLNPKEIISSDDFCDLASKLSNNKHKFDNAWFGYISYEMLHQIEEIPKQENSFITLSQIWFANFSTLIIFDHLEQTAIYANGDNFDIDSLKQTVLPSQAPKISHIKSHISQQDYIEIIKQTKTAIKNGEFSQANITRKISGEFAEMPDNFAIFCRLVEASPAAYSAFIKIGDKAIISSSPECFLNIDAEGKIESRPIKGTSPRFSDPEQDEASKNYLLSSEKELAENLMIVDLMRNDLARSSVVGSVKVDKLFEVSSYKTLHHLSSTIVSQKSPQKSTLDTVINCFPPASMTGTPKIAAIKWCNKQEKIRRGIYSGGLGWFGGDGSCDLSVVIRTLIIDGNRFEFQVGGGITYDSDPQKEWQETIVKSKGIMQALGLDAII